MGWEHIFILLSLSHTPFHLFSTLLGMHDTHYPSTLLLHHGHCSSCWEQL